MDEPKYDAIAYKFIYTPRRISAIVKFIKENLPDCIACEVNHTYKELLVLTKTSEDILGEGDWLVLMGGELRKLTYEQFHKYYTKTKSGSRHHFNLRKQ